MIPWVFLMITEVSPIFLMITEDSLDFSHDHRGFPEFFSWSPRIPWVFLKITEVSPIFLMINVLNLNFDLMDKKACLFYLTIW